jgi:hypothetical protein
MRGLPLKAKPVVAPSSVVDLMSALKRSLAQETGKPETRPRRKAAADRRQTNLLLPMNDRGAGTSKPATTAKAQSKRRKID